MVGLFEPVCAPWKVGRRPGGLLLRRDHPRLGPHGPVPREGDAPRPDLARDAASASSSAARRASRRICSRSSARRRSSKNYFVAAGLNSIGILTGGGLGRVLAHWIINGRPDVDVTGFNIDRLHAYQSNPEYRRTRTVESLGHGLPVPLPDALDRRPRAARSSPPLHDRLAARGAFFRDVSGWEGADWYAPAGRRAAKRSALSWGRQHWFPYWRGRARGDARRA